MVGGGGIGGIGGVVDVRIGRGIFCGGGTRFVWLVRAGPRGVFGSGVGRGEFFGLCVIRLRLGESISVGLRERERTTCSWLIVVFVVRVGFVV